ncbi:hypothetical protein [Streptomyces sp. NBC_00057]|uniref:hypothetical protein n=1 Tax=Streptomyces sp. NBC_00057 TaxID=2975634 RepID=UPI0032510965
MACLILTAGAALGGATGVAHADRRTPGGTPGTASTPVTPPTTASAGPSTPPSASLGVESSGKGSATPSAVPTTTASGGASAAPAPPASPRPSSPASGSPSTSPSSAAANAGSPPPAAQPPLAGREAGEGRLRPGRQLPPWELTPADSSFDEPDARPAATDPAPVNAVTPAASTSPEAGRPAPQALDGPSVERVQRVSLGAGITLIGVGLGFLAFRLRRPN